MCFLGLENCLQSLFFLHGKKFGTDTAPNGRAVAFTGGELCDLFTNNRTSMVRFQIISHHLKKSNKFFQRYIIINEDFRNIKTIELFIEKYSQISVYMTLLGEQLIDKKVNLLTYKERCSRPPV